MSRKMDVKETWLPERKGIPRYDFNTINYSNTIKKFVVAEPRVYNFDSLSESQVRTEDSKKGFFWTHDFFLGVLRKFPFYAFFLLHSTPAINWLTDHRELLFCGRESEESEERESWDLLQNEKDVRDFGHNRSCSVLVWKISSVEVKLFLVLKQVFII